MADPRSLYIPDSAREEILRRSLPGPGQLKAYRDPVTGDGYAMIHENDPLVVELLKSRASQSPGIPRRVSPALHSMGYYQGIKQPTMATSITFEVLRKLARTPIVSGIIETRCDQGSNYWRPPRHDRDTGFDIFLRDEDQRMTPGAKKRCLELRQILLHGGIRDKHPTSGEPAVWDGTYETKSDSFVKTNQAIWRDSLVFDGAAVRIEPGTNEKKFPLSFFKVEDAAQIRRTQPQMTQEARRLHTIDAESEPYKPDIRKNDKDILFVELESTTEKVLREYRWNEMSYWVRNIRSDIWVHGYGYSELERCIEAIVGLMGAMAFNVEFFTNNHIPPGLLFGSGDYNEEWLEEFKYHLHQNVGGAGKWHVLPMLLGDENAKMDYIRFRDNEKLDMQWDRWSIFLINLLHSIFRTNPEETGWQSFSTKTSTLNEASKAETIVSGEDKGLKPLLRDSEDFWDAHIERVDEEFRFGYVGVDPDDEQKRDTLAIQRVQAGISHPWEERRQRDMAEIKDPLDEELYEKIKAKCMELKPDLEEEDPEALDDWVNVQYEKNGGMFALWPKAPVSPSQTQIWQQEHQAHFQRVGEIGLTPEEIKQKKQMSMGIMPGMQGGEEGDQQSLPPWQQQRALPGGQGNGNGDEEEQKGKQMPDYMKHSFLNRDEGHAAPPGYQPFGKALISGSNGNSRPRTLDVIVTAGNN